MNDKPKDFFNDGTNLKNKIEDIDLFLSDSNINISYTGKSNTEDQSSSLEIPEKVIELAPQNSVKINCKEKNFTVLIEGKHGKNKDLGSGFIVKLNEKDENICILTAAHCIAHKDNGIVEKMDLIGVRVPLLDKYETEPNRAQMGKKDNRFFNFLVKRKRFFVYPDYFYEKKSTYWR